MLRSLLEMSIVLAEEDEVRVRKAAVPFKIEDSDVHLKRNVREIISDENSRTRKRNVRPPSRPAERCPIDVAPMIFGGDRRRVWLEPMIHVVDPGLSLYSVARDVVEYMVEQPQQQMVIVAFLPLGHARQFTRELGSRRSLAEGIVLVDEDCIYKNSDWAVDALTRASRIIFMQPNLCGYRAVCRVLEIVSKRQDGGPVGTVFSAAFPGFRGSGRFDDLSDLAKLLLKPSRPDWSWRKRDTWDRKYFDYREVADWVASNVLFHGLEDSSAEEPAEAHLTLRPPSQNSVPEELDRVCKYLESHSADERGDSRFLEAVERAADDLERAIVAGVWIPNFRTHLRAGMRRLEGATVVVVCADRESAQNIEDALEAAETFAGRVVATRIVDPQDEGVFQLRDHHAQARGQDPRRLCTVAIMTDRAFETHGRAAIVDAHARVRRVYCARIERSAAGRVVDLAKAYFRGSIPLVEIFHSTTGGGGGGRRRAAAAEGEGARRLGLTISSPHPFYERSTFYRTCGIPLSKCEGARGGLFTDGLVAEEEREEKAAEQLEALVAAARGLCGGRRMRKRNRIC